MKPKILLSVKENKDVYTEAVNLCGGIAVAEYCPEISDASIYDGLILCGGNDISPKLYGEEIDGAVDIDYKRDNIEIELIQKFLDEKKPILGICRGAQILNVYFGGTLYQDIDNVSLHRSSEEPDAVHAVSAKGASFMRDLYGEEFCVNSVHHQAVKVLGEGLQEILIADDGKTIEGFQHKELPVIAVQWHPERICYARKRGDTVDGSNIFTYFLNLCRENMDLKTNHTSFMGIPVMDVPSVKFAKTEHYGAGSYVTVVEGTTKDDYQSYLKSVEEYGFVKYADSGAGLGGTVLCSTYTRDELVLTVAYYSYENKTSIAFYQDMPLSEHLIYRDSYLENNKKGAQTSIHMMELRRLGNSFVFQLKNGHFLISDGGMPYDLPYLLDYLEELTPDGEKPVIEAWVISHAHGDHCGAFVAFLDHADWRDRVCVDGLYFSEPSARIIHRCGGEMVIAKTKRVARLLTTTEGDPTPLHRMQTGQRYYFNDITMDILLTQEQIPYEKYKKNLNTSSTVCLFTIEGQKCFFSGDIHQEGLEFIMANYSREFLDLDVFTLNHHGFDTCVSFVDYISVKTLLLTVQNQLPVRKIREINYFISKVQEAMAWGDGTKILTFPYEIGSYECLPCKEWIYNEGEERLLQMNIYTFPGRRLKGFIFHAEEVVFHNKTLRPGVEKLVKHLKENEVHMSIYSMKKSTAELADSLQSAGIEEYFELLLGCEKLNADNPYTDATRQSEEVFRLDHVHKYVVVCHSDEVVEAAVQEGLRTIVVTYGIEIDKHLEEKCWESMDSLENIYELFERRKILFE